MPVDLLGGAVETSPSLVTSPFLLTGGSTLYYAVEIAFANHPLDATLTWTDVTVNCKGFTYNRGRQHELNQMQSGTGSVALKNLTRDFEPAYSGSAYYPNVVPVKPIRVWMNLNGTQHICFTHFIERWPAKRRGSTYSEQDITTVDGFRLLSNIQLPGATYPSETTGARINRVLNAAGWPAGLRNIATGTSTVQAYTFADTDNVTALPHIQSMEQAENGLFFIAGDGTATFYDRNTLQSSPHTVSQVTISDRTADVTGGIAGITYSDSVPSFDVDLIVNDWIVTPTGVVTQEAIDSTSQAQYGVSSQSITPPLTTAADALALAQVLALTYKQPLLRHDSLTIRPGRSATVWQQVLTRELGDRITVIEHPPGSGMPYDADELIQWINVTVGDDIGDATCEWGTYPASLGANFLVHDDATLGTLDSTNSHGY